MAGKARQGLARRGKAGLGKAGEDRQGMDWRGWAGPGAARQATNNPKQDRIMNERKRNAEEAGQ